MPPKADLSIFIFSCICVLSGDQLNFQLFNFSLGADDMDGCSVLSLIVRSESRGCLHCEHYPNPLRQIRRNTFKGIKLLITATK